MSQQDSQRPDRQRRAGARQPARQQRPGPRQPARDRADGPAELFGRLPVGLPFQLAEDDGQAVLLGQAGDLPIQPLERFVRVLVRDRFGFGHLPGRAFAHPPLRPGRPRFHGRLVCHPVEPVAELLPRHDRSRPPSEDQERRLEGVFGVVVMPEDPAADAPDERSISLDDPLEGRSVTPSHEPIQQLPVREHPDGALVEERAELSNRRMHVDALHHAAPSIVTGLYPSITRSSPDSYSFLGILPEKQIEAPVPGLSLHDDRDPVSGREVAISRAGGTRSDLVRR